MPGRILIADDEPLIRARLRRLLAAHTAYTVVAEAADGIEAASGISVHRPDVVFLDIRMPGLDGLAVAAAVPGTADHAPAVVFVTAYDEYAVGAFDVGAVDYLVKPIDATKVARALARAERRCGERMGRKPPESEPAWLTRFAARDPKGTYFVPAAEVQWIDAAGGNYVRLHAGPRTHLVRATITVIARMLDPAVFLRVHRSVILRVDQISRFKPHAHGEYIITLRDGTRVTSSRTYRAHVRARLR